MNSRERTRAALRHEEPDRVPADFLATPEVWDALMAHCAPIVPAGLPDEYLEPRREALLRHLEIDLRVVSYDMFCDPPGRVLGDGEVDWWRSRDRSTPNRMWRTRHPDGTTTNAWGIRRRTVPHAFGAYDELAGAPLAGMGRPTDLDAHPCPEADWWDFSPLPGIVRALDPGGELHLRFRIGSVFETAWQLRGMQALMIDLAINPEFARAIMTRITDVHVENTRRVLDLLGDRLDLVHLYDDVAAQTSLLISPDMWRTAIRPHHARLVELAHSRRMPVMYHTDGAVSKLIPELIELGIDVLNPIQPGLEGMDPRGLKEAYGDRLAFHGGIDIVGTLPHGAPDQVAAEVRDRVEVLGRGGGYVLCSSHHVQPDTHVENVLAMVDPTLRARGKR